jgi:DNA-binding helix-hairpin-helix protein with protein kinase domain
VFRRFYFKTSLRTPSAGRRPEHFGSSPSRYSALLALNRMLIDLGVQIVPNVQTVEAVYKSNWFQSFPTFKTFPSNIREQLRNSEGVGNGARKQTSFVCGFEPLSARTNFGSDA